jgi:hypothetical protein
MPDPFSFPEIVKSHPAHATYNKSLSSRHMERPDKKRKQLVI